LKKCWQIYASNTSNNIPKAGDVGRFFGCFLYHVPEL